MTRTVPVKAESKTAAHSGIGGFLLTRGSAVVLVNVTASILAFLVNIVLARSLGDVRYGVYAYVMAWVGLLSIPIGLGLPSLITRETARYSQNEDWARVKGIIHFGTIIVISMSVLCLATLPLVMRIPVIQSFKYGVLAYAIGLAIVPLMGLASTYSSGARGLGKILYASIPIQILRPTLFLVFLGLLIWQTGATVVGALASQLLAGLIVTAVVIWVVFRAIPGSEKKTKPVLTPKTWLHNSMFFMVCGGGFFINSRADILMLGFFFADSDQIGVYNVAARTATMVGIALAAIASAIAPRVVKYYRENKPESLQYLMSNAARLALVFTLPMALIVFFYGADILAFVYGEEYRKGQFTLVMLVFAQTFNVSIGSVALALNMTGHEKLTAIGVWIGASINIVINLCLIPIYGINGAATATAISLMVWTTLLLVFVVRTLKINPTVFAWTSTKNNESP